MKRYLVLILAALLSIANAADYPEWIFDVGEPNQSGLLESFESDNLVRLPRLVKDTGLTRRFRFVQASQNDERIWDEFDVTGATIEAAVGDPDEPPTGGTFSGSYSGDTTSLVNLSATISAATLSTAINTNTTVAAAGGASVTKTGNEFVITFTTVGDKAQFVWDGTALTPSAQAVPLTVVPGDASTREVQILRLVQYPWAYTSTFTAAPAGAVTVTNAFTGTTALPHIHRVALTPEPYGGAFNLTFSRTEVTLVGARSNAATIHQWLVTVVGDTAGNLAGKFFDIVDATAIVRVWLSNGGAAPNVPTGGRLLMVTYVNGDTAAVLAGKMHAAIDADAQFTSYLYDSVTPKIHIGLTAAGAHAAYPSSVQNLGPMGFVLATLATGDNGALAGKYFLLQDKDGPVAVWFFVAGETQPNTGDFNRAIQVTIVAGNTAAAVATAINTAVDADAQFVSTVTGSAVTVTDALGGVRALATFGNATGTTVTRKTAGLHVSSPIPFDADATLVAELMGENFTVTKTGPFQWDLTSVTLGAQPAITGLTAGLVWPKWYEATLSLNRLALHQAFGALAEDDDELTAILEVRITFPGKDPLVVYHDDVVVVRNLIDIATLGYLVWGASPRILTGTVTWNPADVATGASAFTNVTVTGAAIGDIAVGSFSALSGAETEGSFITAVVRAADTVNVSFHNFTGANVNLPSGTVRADVIKH